jgi:YaaC-like Protein
MAEVDWHKCKFLESTENLKPLVKKRFGREPSSSIAREIGACLLQGRLFYEAAASSPLEIRPLQQFYGMVGFAKALIVSSSLNSLATLRPAHGLTDISAGNSRISDLRLRIERTGGSVNLIWPLSIVSFGPTPILVIRNKLLGL